MAATYGGIPVFGLAVSIEMTPNANAAQIAAFFGVQGVQSLDGGQRGRAFMISGLMVGDSPAGVQAGEQQLEQFATGIAQTLVDTTGIAWPNVVYRNEFQWAGKYGQLCDNTGRWCRPYKCVMHGLT